jgi:N-acetylglucosamine-6-phosphate deacetylase
VNKFKNARHDSNDTPCSEILGLHLEGPFINSAKRGAHRRDFVQDQTRVTSVKQLLDVYGQLDNIRMITFAPELFDDSVIAHLNLLGIVPSIGHCCATLDQCKTAIQNGARCITHLFNAMPAFHHREPSVIGSLTLRDRHCLSEVKGLIRNGHSTGTKVSNGFGPSLTNGHQTSDVQSKLPNKLFYGIISDGVHTHESAVALAYRTYAEGLILVTDAVAPLGLQSNQVHKLGTNTIEIKEDRAYIYGTDTLCGSIAPLDACLRRFVESTSCDAVQAINCATLNPATLLGLAGKKGDLAFGSDADFVLLNDQLHVQSTYIDGRLAWKSKSN